MGYKMIEISTEKQGELMEHAEKAYKHIGKMLECIEQMSEGKMGMREDDEWYLRRMNHSPYGERDGMGERYGERDEMGERYGERRGVRGTGRYGSRMEYRDPYYY